MLEFIKMFGLGVLYTILLPFIIIIFALSLVFVFANYLVLESKTLFGFFFGYTFSTETELEQKLEEMKNGSDSLSNGEREELAYEYKGENEELQDGEMKGSDE